ncbi:MAG: DUF1269 domain-containing protein [Anaerolineae bacterium]|nr:DUF1269 domain-containing protein [Anaerolineae bacterium]
MSENASMHLIIAAFDGQARAEEALKTLKESQDEKLIGVQAAVALRKDEAGQIHFKDVGLSPGKGVLGGVVLGAAVGILTGGTGLALGAVGALVGGIAGKRKQKGGLPAERLNQLAATLAPGSSALLIVMEPGWVVVLEEELELLGAKLLTLEIPADIAERPAAERDAAFAALIAQLRRAEQEEDDS